MTAEAVTLESLLAELRDLARSLRGRATKRQRPRLDSLLLPIQHAAELLGVSRPTLRELVRDGELLEVKLLNGDPRITRRSLEEYLQRLEEKAAKPKRRALRSVPRAPVEKKRKRTLAEVLAAMKAIPIDASDD